MASSPRQQAQAFVGALFGKTLPSGLHVALWSKETGSRYLSEPAEVGESTGLPDMYIAACLTSRKVGKNKRPTAAEAAGMPGVWADIDVVGGPEQPANKRAAPDREKAMEVAESILDPTIVVDSGYGLQAWWLFDDVHLMSTKEEREAAARIALGWQTLLRFQANARDFSIDSTHDLARLMRLPGTINDKGPPKQQATVEILRDDGPRHTFEAIAEIATEAAPRMAGPAAGVAKVKLDHPFPMVKFEALRDNDEQFRKTWEHTRRDRDVEGWSTSEYDMALASIAARRGWTDDEIAVLIVTHRKKWNGEHDPKAGRADYIGRTVARARAGEKREEKERIREEALHEMAAAGEEGGAMPDPKSVMALFNQVISSGEPQAPKFKELIQYNSDPDSARYVLVMEDGGEVNVGSYENLRQPRRLDSRIGPVTGWVLESVKDNDVWREAMRVLLRTRTIREDEDEPVYEWVRRYTEDRLAGKPAEAALAGEPFEEKGWIYVKAAPLARFAKKVLAENVGSSDMLLMLRRAGFEQRAVKYTSANGQQTTAGYWRITKEELA